MLRNRDGFKKKKKNLHASLPYLLKDSCTHPGYPYAHLVFFLIPEFAYEWNRFKFLYF